METFPAARKLGDVTDWPCDQCISEVSLDGCVDNSRSFCWSLKGFIDKVADVHFLHQGEALRLQRPPVHFCVDGCCWKKHSDKAILNDDSIRPALVNLLAAASICLKLGQMSNQHYFHSCLMCVTFSLSSGERKQFLSAPAIPAKMIQKSPCGRSLHGNSRNMSGVHGVWSWWWVTRDTTVAGCAKGQPNLGYFGCQGSWT